VIQIATIIYRRTRLNHSSVRIVRYLAAAALGIFTTQSFADASEPKAKQAWPAGSIAWQSVGANGTKYALLEGSRDQPGGTFTYAFFIPAGTWDQPHVHNSTVRVFVASGALSIGYGDELRKGDARSYRAGSVLLVPSGARHFDGAAVDTVIIGVATGPWSTHYLDDSQPPSAGTPVKR